jgi:hypothetical protein
MNSQSTVIETDNYEEDSTDISQSCIMNAIQQAPREEVRDLLLDDYERTQGKTAFVEALIEVTASTTPVVELTNN